MKIGTTFDYVDTSWTIKRQDAHGVFHASHNLEFSCYEIPVTGEALIAAQKVS